MQRTMAEEVVAALRLRQALTNILTDWPHLQVVHIGGGNVTGGGNATQLPGGTNRVNLIAEIHDQAGRDCRTVMRAKDLVGPGNSTELRLRFLVVHVDTLATEKPNTALEWMDLAGRITALVAPTGTRRIPISACPVLDCQGTIYAHLHADGDGTLPDLVCDVHRDHTWAEPHYQRLAALLQCDGPSRVTLDQLREHLADRYHRTITQHTLTSWVRDYPITLAYDPADQTVDRVRAVSHYLAQRAAKATAAA